MEELNNFYVYKHVRLDNNKTFYVGKGINYRAYDKCNRNIYWKRITNKYPYKVIIVKSNLTEKEAYSIENQMTLLFKRYGRAETNLNTDYGIGGRMGRSDESYKIMGQNLSENRNRSYKGENNPMYGKTFSEEHKKKISDGNKGKLLGIKKSDEHRKNISIGLTGRKLSPEQCERLSKLHKGKVMSEESRKKMSISGKGRKHRPESILKMKKPKPEGFIKNLVAYSSKKIIDSKTNIIYDSMSEASRILKIDRKKISRCVHGIEENDTTLKLYETNI